jgi:hypothetical protein
MGQSPSTEANSHSAAEEIPCLLWNPKKVHYHVHRSPPPVHIFLTTSIRSTQILSSHLPLDLPSGLFPSAFPDQNVVCIYLIHACYIPHPWVNEENWTHLRSATCAAMTRCRSTTSWQLGHWHSRHRHSRLCPLRQEITPWLRHRAHFGVLSSLLPAPAPPRPPPTTRSVGVFIPWKTGVELCTPNLKYLSFPTRFLSSFHEGKKR